jgi:hypothetical protein
VTDKISEFRFSVCIDFTGKDRSICLLATSA